MKYALCLLLAFVAILMAGCSLSDTPESTNDGNYVIFSGENNVRLLVIQNGTKLSAEGTYENMTGLPPKVSQLAP